ncbi:unnamed protein product [Caenorhabditis brenneri]
MPLPLLRLSEKLTVHVLRTFEMRELLAISILSKRANKAVKHLKLKKEVHFHVGNSIEFEVISKDPTQKLVLEFYKKTRRRNIVLNIPKKVTVTSHGNKIEEWKFPSSKMTMRDWHFHIRQTLHAEIRIYFKFGFTIFNFESIKKAFKAIEFDELSIAENIPNNQSRIILENFLPISNKLELGRNPFQRKEDIRAIFIQNHEFLCYGRENFSLNDMLMCNFSFIILSLPTWTYSDMNHFLKLWIKGACRKLCRLGYFYFPGEWRWNQEEVLKGISFQEVEGDRILKMHDGEVQHLINGGCDIRAMDGRICTITNGEPHFVLFYFYN